MSANVTPAPKFIAFDNTTGAPLAGGLLYTYASGGSSPIPAYKDSALSVAWSNPIQLDAFGRATIYLSPVGYHMTLTDSVGNTIWDVDPVYGTALASDMIAAQAAIAALQTSLGAIAVDSRISGGRLTLTSGTPVTTSDVTAASTIYYTACKISLYNGTAWALFTSPELSLALGTLVNAQAYDVFVYDNSGTRTLELAEWANATVTMTNANPCVVTWTAHGMSTGNSITFTTTGALPTNVVANTQYFITVVDANTFKLSTALTTVASATFIDSTAGAQSGVQTGHQPQARQTALVLQDGALVKSGATTRKYVGAFFTTATTTTEDSAAKRYLSNYYRREVRSLLRKETTATWTYSTGTFHFANASAANLVQLFIGVPEVAVDLLVLGNASNSSGANTTISVAIGEDSSNTPVTGCLMQVAQVGLNLSAEPCSAKIVRYASIGPHAYTWLERSDANATTTWDGIVAPYLQTGMVGGVPG